MAKIPVEKKLSRRQITAAAAGAGALLASPAVAQNTPKIKWRLASSFQRSITMQYETAQQFIKLVSELTDGGMEFQWFGAGELVGAFQVLDAIQNKSIESGLTVSFFYVGKDPTFAIPSGIPFGMNARAHLAWMQGGGGNEIIDAFFGKHNIVAHLANNTGTHMAGWFRKELRTVDDLRGLKMRIAGLAGRVLAKVGGVPQQIPPSDVYQALERGTIDAAKLATPSDDEKVGLARLARLYYFPGWNDPGVASHFMFNKELYAELPPAYRAAIRAASATVATSIQAKYDAANPAALRSLVSQGVQLKQMPPDIVEALGRAATEV